MNSQQIGDTTSNRVHVEPLTSEKDKQPRLVEAAIKGIFASGRFKTLCRAYHKDLGPVVVAHVGSSGTDQMPMETRKRTLLHEISIFELLAPHRPLPHVIEYLGRQDVVTEHEGICPGFVLPFYSGGCLRTHLEKKTLVALDIKQVMIGVSKAIASLHKLQIAHLDLRAENVLLDLTGTGRVKKAVITDFGLVVPLNTKEGTGAIRSLNAKVASPSLLQLWRKAKSIKDGATRAQIIDKEVVFASDVYSLGLLFDQMIDWSVLGGGIYEGFFMDEDDPWTAADLSPTLEEIEPARFLPKGSLPTSSSSESYESLEGE